MLVQNPRIPISGPEIKFRNLDEYLDFIDKSKSWKSGFEWYCKFSVVLFSINEKELVNELVIEGPHIIELCNTLVKAKSDKGIKIRFKSSEANWNFYAELSRNEINELKEKLVLWNKSIQSKIDSQGLSEFVIKKQHLINKRKKIDRVNKIISIVLILFIFSIIAYYLFIK